MTKYWLNKERRDRGHGGRERSADLKYPFTPEMVTFKWNVALKKFNTTIFF